MHFLLSLPLPAPLSPPSQSVTESVSSAAVTLVSAHISGSGMGTFMLK